MGLVKKEMMIRDGSSPAERLPRPLLSRTYPGAIKET